MKKYNYIIVVLNGANVEIYKKIYLATDGTDALNQFLEQEKPVLEWDDTIKIEERKEGKQWKDTS